MPKDPPNNGNGHHDSPNGKSLKGKGGPKFSSEEREAILEKVAMYDRRGYGQFEIANLLKVSQQTVSDYLKTIKERYRQSTLESQAYYVAEKLQQYREIRWQAWRAWERSEQDFIRRKTEKETIEIKPKKGRAKKEDKGMAERETHQQFADRIKRTLERTERLPHDGYLTLIKQTIDAECRLLGLDASIKVDLNNNIINWDEVAKQLAKPVPDNIETLLNSPAAIKAITGRVE